MLTKDEIKFTLVFALPIPAIVGSIFSSFNTFLLLFTIIGFISARYIINTRDRKEPLSVLLDDNQLHFMLSDDNFLDVPLKKEQNISEVITNTVKNEMATIKQMVDRIYLVNIKDEQLQNQLNNMIVKL